MGFKSIHSWRKSRILNLHDNNVDMAFSQANPNLIMLRMAIYCMTALTVAVYADCRVLEHADVLPLLS